MLKKYVKMTKPGIIMGNLITAVGGFALASKGQIDLRLFAATLTGIAAIIGSACVFNNYLDRHSDQKMARTSNRALAKGTIPLQNALIFATLLGIIGTLTLALATNLLTLVISAIGFFVYVVVYSNMKYRSALATLVGSIAGAMPALVGYCSVSNRFDTGAFLLLTIMVLWQMPHFFAIALYRLDDYAAASIPVLPLVKGIPATKLQMLLYVIAFMFAAALPTLFGYTGYVSFIVAAILSLTWLRLAIKGFKSPNDKLWARQMFIVSLVAITTLFITLSIDRTRAPKELSLAFFPG